MQGKQFSFHLPTSKLTTHNRERWEWYLINEFGAFWTIDVKGTCLRRAVRSVVSITIYHVGVQEGCEGYVFRAASYAARILGESAVVLCDGVNLFNVNGDDTECLDHTADQR